MANNSGKETLEEKLQECVNIVPMLGYGYAIYHVKSEQENHIILNVENRFFNNIDEARIYCDLKGYLITCAIDCNLKDALKS